MKIKLSIIPLMTLLLSSCVIQNSNASGDLNSKNSTIGSKIPKTIKLTYSGSASNKEFNNSLFEKFKKERKNAGDKNTYIIDYYECDPNLVTSKIENWSSGPDIYEFTTGSFKELYKLGALSKLTDANATFINENYSDYGKKLATYNGEYYAYPYAGDSTYYIHYNKSFFNENDVKSIETMLDLALTHGKKIGFPLDDSFYGGAIMFTFGANCNVSFDETGSVISTTADFNTEEGIKAAKAIQKIGNHPAWKNAGLYPYVDAAIDNDTVAYISGHWYSSFYKNKFEEKYACAAMPTITIDGDTKHLSAFLDGLAFGINPKSLDSDNDRLVAAYELAKFLSNEESQLARFEDQNLAPCNIDAITNNKISSNPNAQAIISQYEFAITQNNIPTNFWTSVSTLLDSIVHDEINSDQGFVEALNSFNDSIIKGN